MNVRIIILKSQATMCDRTYIYIYIILFQKKADEKRENDALLTKTNSTGARRMSNGSMWTKDQNVDELKVTENDSFVKRIKTTFDLDLLKNSTYLNVSLGCSLFYVAETNFKLITPFFLSNIGE